MVRLLVQPAPTPTLLLFIPNVAAVNSGETVKCVQFVSLCSTYGVTSGKGHSIYLKGIRENYSDWLRAGRSGDRIPVEARFSAPVQTGPGAHTASCTIGTGSFPGVKSGRDVTLTTHPLLVPWSRKSRAIPVLPLWAVWPVQSLSAYTRVHFTFL